MLPYHDSSSSIQFLDNGTIYVCIRGNASASIPANCDELGSHEVRALLRGWSARGARTSMLRLLRFLRFPDHFARQDQLRHLLLEHAVKAFESGRYTLLRERPLRGLHPVGVSPGGEDLAPEDLSDEVVEHWVEITVTDPQGQGVPHVACHVNFPNGHLLKSRTNLHGVLRIGGIRQLGDCKVTFPGHSAQSIEQN